MDRKQERDTPGKERVSEQGPCKPRKVINMRLGAARMRNILGPWVSVWAGGCALGPISKVKTCSERLKLN